jgi:hypothetical protein
METLPRITLSRAEMMKRIARFKDLKGFDGGLPDSKMARERTLYNVIGFQPPKGEGGAVTSPVGDDAARLAAIKISGVQFRLLPGQARLQTDDAQSRHQRDLHPDDRQVARELGKRGTARSNTSISNRSTWSSFPAGHDPPLRERHGGRPERGSILMFVIGGDAPRAEFTDQAMHQLEAAGCGRRIRSSGAVLESFMTKELAS